MGKNYSANERVSIGLWLFGMSALAIVSGAVALRIAVALFAWPIVT